MAPSGLNYFCPYCWKVLSGRELICPSCGRSLEEYLSLDYEQKCLLALHHPVRENRMIAIQVLGDLGSHAAVAEFEKLLEGNEDYYLIREVLIALTKIKDPRSMDLLQKAKDHPYVLVQRLAHHLIDSVRPRDSDPL